MYPCILKTEHMFTGKLIGVLEVHSVKDATSIRMSNGLDMDINLYTNSFGQQIKAVVVTTQRDAERLRQCDMFFGWHGHNFNLKDQ